MKLHTNTHEYKIVILFYIFINNYSLYLTLTHMAECLIKNEFIIKESDFNLNIRR